MTKSFFKRLKYFKINEEFDTRLSMDAMKYSYKPNTNQLDKVEDSAIDASTVDYDKYKDIKQGQQDGNYQYDAIGNLIADVSEGITNINWNVYGKIQEINKNGNLISYTYDASGNRISKTADGKTTWYVRDASGNVMSVYTVDAAVNNGHLTQSEVKLYGSSRLGIWNANKDITVTPDANYLRGSKSYELANHLGNVLVTITDKKLQHTNDNSTIDYYEADVSTASDYYLGGMEMKSRNYQAGASSYRYSINGQEVESDLNKNITTALYWEYDSRLCRRYNIDPLAHKFPWQSSYCTFDDNPISKIDPAGKKSESIHIDPKGNVLLNKNDGDNSVFVHSAATRKKDIEHAYSTLDHSAGGIKIGKLGGNIKSGIISQILKENKVIASSLPNEFEWVARVLPNSDWDYKNNENTIFGVAWAFDMGQKRNLKAGEKETNTSFTDDVLKGHPTWASAADFGNFNAGYTGIYAKVPILHQYKWAGAGELAKGHLDADNRLNQWMQNVAPYGDNLRDYHFNNFGMQAAFKEMSTGFLKF